MAHAVNLEQRLHCQLARKTTLLDHLLVLICIPGRCIPGRVAG
jgi:hypothetical protein